MEYFEAEAGWDPVEESFLYRPIGNPAQPEALPEVVEEERPRSAGLRGLTDIFSQKESTSTRARRHLNSEHKFQR
jgi:hypothetical protein